jgi:hypothetical protein
MTKYCKINAEQRLKSYGSFETEVTINLDPHFELNVAGLGFWVKEFAMMTMKNKMLQKN